VDLIRHAVNRRTLKVGGAFGGRLLPRMYSSSFSGKARSPLAS
jgi:hypothetical protein